MWTASNQNKGYMTFTSHFIDDSWVLQSRLVRVEFGSLQLKSTNLVMHQMAKAMYAKFEKYWGDIDVLMVVGDVVDPRYKLCFLDFFYPIIYGQHGSEMSKVKSICDDLVKEYEIKMKGKESAFSCSSQSQTLNLIDVGADGVNALQIQN
ncbi:hypothetical protein Lal_00033745 [Lupinus albus]|nr:hypothetical protein Lal_00033745 [Lupinus albus]